MTDQEVVEQAKQQLQAAAGLAAATAHFFRTTARIHAGPTTVHIVGDAAAYERLVQAADRLANQ